MAGPNHKVCQQHVPGYTGHVPGIKSENLFAKTYAKNTVNAIGFQHPKGHDVPVKVRYTSMTKTEYKPKNFRRFIEQPAIQPKKDFNDYTKYVNEEMATRR